MVLQTGSQFTRFGQTALTGDVVAIALVRGIGTYADGDFGGGTFGIGYCFGVGVDAGDGNKLMPCALWGRTRAASW